MGTVRLGVADLPRMMVFYRDVLGLSVQEESEGAVTLGVANGLPLVELNAIPNAQPPNRRATGLFHLAILYPSRSALGKALIQLAQSGWRLSGAGDHVVSEALYLSDPEGNGIELYCDRPKSTWTFHDGQVHMDTLPVDIDSIVNEAQQDQTPWTGVPTGTVMGHVHLKVSDLEATQKFYGDVLGFDLMATMPQALFMAVGGYHHHLGLNTWMSAGSPPPSEDLTGLRGITIDLPSDESLELLAGHLDAVGQTFVKADRTVHLVDPCGNQIQIKGLFHKPL